MIQTRTIGTHTEIYVGGGNYITQSAPTNFHGFWTRKILTAGETEDDYKEVTAKEKTALENADAEWTEPSEEFVAQCTAAGVVYNRLTGYFELNGLTDLTETQMRAIISATSGKHLTNQSVSVFENCRDIRTHLPITMSPTICGNKAFRFCFMLEVVKLVSYYGEGRNILIGTSMDSMFGNCYKLKRVDGVLEQTLNSVVVANAFTECRVLEEIRIILRSSTSFQWTPYLSLASIEFMVDNAANLGSITITLHPDAYARLTDELIDKAAEKSITFATPE